MSVKKRFFADFHIHSHYSRATSKSLTPENLHFWAEMKGITVLGTGDFTHPGWLAELEEKLTGAEPGLYKLKDSIKNDFDKSLVNETKSQTRFMLTGEVSSIYKKNDKVRKVHNILFAPNFEVVRLIQNKLSKIGNIRSDGRPILGLDSKDLLDLVLNISTEAFLVPAHIWTPWFSMLGSKSGFDNINECFEELSEHIFAIETGLSSDPAMNWKCSFLDNISIISNSDAHSPENLGREVNIFNTELSYYSIKNALKENNNDFIGTLEFYPEEGKYHYDGHRKCNICLSPEETLQHKLLCPVCGKPLTLGVSYRVEELSDRKNTDERKNKKSFYSIIPLKEILSEILSAPKASKKVNEKYFSLLKKYGSELDILQNNNSENIKKNEPLLSEALERMHNGKIIIQPGYDGEYGIIKVFNKNEIDSLKSAFFFNEPLPINTLVQNEKKKSKNKTENIKNKISHYKLNLLNKTEIIPEKKYLNDFQLDAAKDINGPSLIIAGPGTGKTLTLVYKICEIIKSGVNPQNILALTFSNAAAKEIKERINKTTGNDSEVTVYTFHSLGLSIIRDNINSLKLSKDFCIINDQQKEFILKEDINVNAGSVKNLILEISLIKANLIELEKIDSTEIKNIFNSYNEALNKYNLFDFDDLLYIPYKLLTRDKYVLNNYKEKFKWILIDEFQDLNRIQFELVKLFTDNQKPNITAIGDPNQAIYGFRGADNRFIKSFCSVYDDVKTFHLERSYRCTNNILAASSDIIKEKKNEQYFLSGVLKGTRISINEFGTEKSEAEFIARKIESLMGGIDFFSFNSNISEGYEDNGFHFSDFAVLTRVTGQFNALEKAFFDHSIPFQKINEVPFYEKPPFNDILSIIKYFLSENNLFLKKQIKNFTITENIYHKMKNILKNYGLRKLFDQITAEYFNDITEIKADEIKFLQDITEKYNLTPDKFITEISTLRDIDFIEKKFDTVKLLTMHASKGLEFENIFIAGCGKLIVPFTFFENYKINNDEEKRLMYVAMTRAKKNLFISYSNSVKIYNQKIKSGKSDFINKINEELLLFDKQSRKKDDGQLPLF